MPRKNQDRILDDHLITLIAQGNHDALAELEKRYHKHSLHLVNQLLIQYPSTGISKKELVAVCESHFPFVVMKYSPLKHSSFLTFWKESTKNSIMDYLIDNSYNGGAFSFRGVISLDEADEESLCYGEIIAEKNNERITKKRIFEIRTEIYRFKNCFTDLEFTVLNLVLVGYTYPELEHSGMMSRTTLHLTFKNAVRKLHNLMRNIEKNSK